MSLCLYYCRTCLTDQGRDPRAAHDGMAKALPEGCDIEAAECMNMCGNPVSIAWRDGPKAAYLFSGVDPLTQSDDLAAFARLYLESETGAITDARSCGNLRFQLVGRLPPQASRSQR